MISGQDIFSINMVELFPTWKNDEDINRTSGMCNSIGDAISQLFGFMFSRYLLFSWFKLCWLNCYLLLLFYLS